MTVSMERKSANVEDLAVFQELRSFDDSGNVFSLL